MKTKNMIWAALSMTAALVMTACSNDDNTVETPAAPQAEVKTIPYSVTVNGGAGTRATVADDPSDATTYHKTLKFATGDKLYITGTNISGVLTLKSGDEGKSSGATFSGDLTYTGDGSPASDLSLNAVLVGTYNKGWNIEDGKATTFSYPNNAYCADVNEAVEKYSLLMGTSTYSAKSFTLKQQTAFLNFEITFKDGTTTGTTLSAVVSNNGSAIATANVTTTTVGGKVVAKFVLPVMSSVTTLSGATVQMGDKTPFGIKNATLDGKVFNIQRTQVLTDLSTISAIHTANDGETLTGTLGSNVKISIADGAIITLDGININKDWDWKDGTSAGITCLGDAIIILEGTNTVKGLGKKYPGIYVPSGKTLTIMGTGSLTASSGVGSDNSGMGDGIGGGTSGAGIPNCGNIVIKGGTIIASGGPGESGWGAGIGTANGNCGNITISGGNVTATGGSSSPGIGGNCGDIIISGGTVTATAGNGDAGAAGIGSMGYRSCGNITISGGTVIAKGSTDSYNYTPGAGIGGGIENAACGVITITSGVTSVTATKGGGDGAESIGKGKNGTAITVNIDGVENATTSSTFTNFDSSVSGNTWTLTHK